MKTAIMLGKKDGEECDSINILKSGLIAVYELDETSGNQALDSYTVQGPYDMGILGALYNQSGKIGTSYYFDGINDYLTTIADNNLAPQANHSINVWFKRTGDSASDSSGSLLSKYASFTGQRIYLTQVYATDFTTPNLVRAVYYDTTDTATIVSWEPPSDIWTNVWNMLTYTRAGSVMKLYINGDLKNTVTGGNGNMQQEFTTVVDNIGSVTKSSTEPDLFFEGYIDQTAIWSRALTEDDICNLYNFGDGFPYVDWLAGG